MEINERLDLSSYGFGTGVRPLRYRLVSMIEHYGTTPNSGHYATVGFTASGSYYYFNDSDVRNLYLLYFRITLIYFKIIKFVDIGLSNQF